jgi:hypothetical protein
MAIVSYVFEQLFMLLVPEPVFWFEGVCAVIFPNEPDLVQNYPSILSNFVVVMIAPLPSNPPPQRLVLLVTLWHPTMSIDPFKLNKLFMFHVPLLVMFRHGSQKTLLEAKLGG